MRDHRIDIMRAVGLLMIVLAHASPPALVFQLRNFDVPLMVVVSGLSFVSSYRPEPFGSYVWKRIKRLAMPVWLFLLLFFVGCALLSEPYALPAAKTIVGTFLFQSGIGYVWIIRVFLMVALLAPLLMRWNLHAAPAWQFVLACALAYLGFECLLDVATQFHAQEHFVLKNFVFLALPYAIVFLLGMRLASLTRQQTLRWSAVFLVLFVACGLWHFSSTGVWVPTQEHKYPPRLYYLSYALFVTFLLWSVMGQVQAALERICALPAALFLGQNSIWIYLWHIPFAEAVKAESAIKYPVVLLTACLLAWAQSWLVHKVILPRTTSSQARRNIQAVLTG